MTKMDIFKIGGMLGLLKNKIRLNIMLILEEQEKAYFKEIYEKLLERGINIRPSLLAYHLEVLIRAKLVKNKYQRNERGYSEYSLTEAGKKALEILKKAEKSAKTVKI